MEQHTHGPDGLVILADQPEAIEAEAVEEVAEAEVRIAEINANRDVQIAKLAAKAEENEEQTELEQLRGEVRALREIVDLLKPADPEPEPEPAPVIVEAPPAAEEPTEEAPPVVEHKAPKAKSSGLAWF